MILSINQPAYLPWSGYFHRIAVSDEHIVLDHVQFEKNSFTNRNKVRTKEGSCWLTVPVHTKGLFGNLAISELETVNDTRWPEKHWNALQCNYRRAPFFRDHEAFFKRLFSARWVRLMDLMREINAYLLEALSIGTPLKFSSDMGGALGRKDELVLQLCQMTGTRTYLSGPLGRGYIHEPLFEKERIRVLYQDYRDPVYPQVYPGFEPNMCVLDVLFNCGQDALEVICRDQQTAACMLAKQENLVIEPEVRSVRREDIIRLWEMANDPSSRVNAFQIQPIRLRDHMVWCSRRIDSPDCRMWLLCIQGVMVAQVRFDKTEPDVAEVDISVAREFRGRGLGALLLGNTCARACEELRVKRLRAIIFCSNQPSIKVFEKTGFKRTVPQATIKGQECVICEWTAGAGKTQALE